MASYIIRKIDDTLWQDMKAKAATEERGLRAVVLRLFKAYTYGTAVDAVDPAVTSSVDLTPRDSLSENNSRLAAKGTV